MQDTWPKEEREIKSKGYQGTSIECTRGPPDYDRACALKEEVITALMKRAGSTSRPSDRDPRDAISCIL